MSENIYSTGDMVKITGFSRGKIFRIFEYLKIDVPKIKAGNSYRSIFRDEHLNALQKFVKDTPNIKSVLFKQTSIDKYGVDNPGQSPEVRAKFKQTCLERYGVDSPSKVDAFKQKSKNTCLEKYGVEYSFQSKEMKDKAKVTCLDRYGTPYAMQSDDIKSKVKKTCLERYGVDSFSKTQDFIVKLNETCQAHYGVNFPAQDKGTYDKIRKTCIDRYNGIGFSSEELNDKAVNSLYLNHGVKHNMLDPIVKKKVFSHKGMTSPEKKINSFLENRKFDFIYQYDCNGKCFDFAIFKDSNLSILIEIDGEYNHGLLSDYDGKLVKGYNDALRFYKVPDGVKFIVCDSNNIEKCFSEILRVFNIDYRCWLDEIISSLPESFPFPVYTEMRLRKDFEHLCKYSYNKGQRLGDSTIKQFHKSIWYANRDGFPSPYDAWQNKELLEKCVENRFIYSYSLSSQAIVNGFNVCKLAPKVSVFSASLAKYLIDKYLSQYNVVFDPFSGFSGRLLGTCSTGKKYIGQDVSGLHVLESKAIIDFHQLDAEIYEQDILLDSKKSFECLFTCPPYGNKEHWCDDEAIHSCDEWIDICLSTYECKNYLFVVDNTFKYKNNVVEIIKNDSHFGSNEEYVILI